MQLLLLLACALQSPPHHPRFSSLELHSGWTLDAQGKPVRDLLHLPGRDVQLFDGKSLAGWHAIGEATFSADEASILAQTSVGKVNSFLVSDASFADFLLTIELKNEQPGNSGIQIRSRVVGNEPKTSYATGYQIEIDPSARAWSGGLYEERGRGWLQNLEHDEAGRKAFHPGEWNRYRIECIGPWIRAWVNDVPTTDALDPEALTGILALQVHAGQDTKVRFRSLQLHVFGEHTWTALDAAAFAKDGARLGSDFGLRLTRPSGPSPLTGFRLLYRGERGQTPGPSIDLDDPGAALGKPKPNWTQIVVLAYSDRLAIFRDHELLQDSRTPSIAEGTWVWIERPGAASEARPFERVESLEPATR